MRRASTLGLIAISLLAFAPSVPALEGEECGDFHRYLLQQANVRPWREFAAEIIALSLSPQTDEVPEEEKKSDWNLRAEGHQVIDIRLGYAQFINKGGEAIPNTPLANPIELILPLEFHIRGEGLEDQMSVEIDYNTASVYSLGPQSTAAPEGEALRIGDPDRFLIKFEGKKWETDFGDVKIDAMLGKDIDAQLGPTEYTIYNKKLMALKGSINVDDPFRWRVFGDKRAIERIKIEGIVGFTRGESATKVWQGNFSTVDKTIPDTSFINNTYYFLGAKNIDVGSVIVYVDNRDGSDNSGGFAAGGYYFDKKYAPRDYTVDHKGGVLEFTQPIGDNYVVAVYYTISGRPATSGVVIDGHPATIIKGETEEGTELKNRYSFEETDILPRELDPDFKLEIVDSARNLLVADITSNPKGRYHHLIDWENGIISFDAELPFDATDPDAYTAPQSSHYSIRAHFKVRQETFKLDHINIKPGSERVYFNGVLLTRDIDYYIFYEVGEIAFAPHISSRITKDTIIRVDYEYLPPVPGGVQTTVGGARFEIEPIKGATFGTTHIGAFDTVGNQPPNIESTPTSQRIHDFDFNLKPLETIRKLNNEAEGEMPWNLEIYGELAHSWRTKNSFNAVYDDGDTEYSAAIVDNMEDLKMRLAVPTDGRGWLQASRPYDPDDPTGGSQLPGDPDRLHVKIKRGKGHNPQLGDLDLMVLEPYKRSATQNFAGIRHTMSPTGEDFTKYSYIEMWIKGGSGTLYIDLGRIDEDTPIGEKYNGKLNSEDANKNGVFDNGEDTGIDGMPGVSDPEGRFDDFHREDNPSGTEGNKEFDTEDTDGDNILDRENAYFEFALPLDFSALPSDDERREWLVRARNGWNFIRIPLSYAFDAPSPAPGEKRRQLGDAPLDKKRMKHIRLWVERGFTGDVAIESLEIVGLTWGYASDSVKDTLGNFDRSKFAIKSISKSEDGSYKPPRGSYDEDSEANDSPYYDDSQDVDLLLEQALLLVENLGDGELGVAKRDFEGGLDLSDYRDLRTEVFLVPGAATAKKVFIRLGDDENYIQIDSFKIVDKRRGKDKESYGNSIPQSGRWLDLIVDLRDVFKALRLYYRGEDYDAQKYSIVGNPYPYSLKALQFGVVGDGKPSEIWVNNIRATGGGKPIEEYGRAWKVGTNFGREDVFSSRAELNRREPHFSTIAEAKEPTVAPTDDMAYVTSADITPFGKVWRISPKAEGERTKHDVWKIVDPKALPDDTARHTFGGETALTTEGNEAWVEAIATPTLTLGGEYTREYGYFGGMSGGMEGWELNPEGFRSDLEIRKFQPRLEYDLSSGFLHLPMGKINAWDLRWLWDWQRKRTLEGGWKWGDPTHNKEAETTWQFRPIAGIDTKPHFLLQYGEHWGEDNKFFTVDNASEVDFGDLMGSPIGGPFLGWKWANSIDYLQTPDVLTVEGAPYVGLRFYYDSGEEASPTRWRVEPKITYSTTADYVFGGAREGIRDPNRWGKRLIVDPLTTFDDLRGDPSIISYKKERIEGVTLSYGEIAGWTIAPRASHGFSWSMPSREIVYEQREETWEFGSGFLSERITVDLNRKAVQDLTEGGPGTETQTYDGTLEWVFDTYPPWNWDATYRTTAHYEVVWEHLGPRDVNKTLNLKPGLELRFPLKWAPYWGWGIFDGRELNPKFAPSLEEEYISILGLDNVKMVESLQTTLALETSITAARNVTTSLLGRIMYLYDMVNDLQSWAGGEVGLLVDIVF
ncbi:MAG: hypothetical protein ACUVXI_10350 [bacterium]